MMAECLHLYYCLKAGFKLEGKVVIIDCDFLDQLPDPLGWHSGCAEGWGCLLRRTLPL